MESQPLRVKKFFLLIVLSLALIGFIVALSVFIYGKDFGSLVTTIIFFLIATSIFINDIPKEKNLIRRSFVWIRSNRQLAVVWFLGIYISIFFVLRQTIYPIVLERSKSQWDLSGLPYKSIWITMGVSSWKIISILLIPVLILGVLLIYTLRNKK